MTRNDEKLARKGMMMKNKMEKWKKMKKEDKVEQGNRNMEISENRIMESQKT